MEDPENWRNSEPEFVELIGDHSAFADPPKPSEEISIEQWRIHCAASRRLAALGGTMPELEDIPFRKSQSD
jgi:hypothetical protein